jgi:hypothetical protein
MVDEFVQEEARKDFMKLMNQAVNTLESIDKSIDFLAAAMTGMDPMDIQIGQSTFGRLASPIMRREKIEETVRIDDIIFEDLIDRELLKVIENHDPDWRQNYGREDSSGYTPHGRLKKSAEEDSKSEFTRKAYEHNMSIPEFAEYVLSNEDDFSESMIHEAEFAKAAEYVARRKETRG